MEKVYNFRQHTYCVIIHIKKNTISVDIISTLNRNFKYPYSGDSHLLSSISYNKQRTDVINFGWDYAKKDKDDIVIDNFRDGLYNLFKKDKETWDEEDNFFMKAFSDFLPAAVKKTMEEKKLEIESFDLFHYAFVVPSEWEKEIRDDMIRPTFVQSGLISNQDHQDRLLFFTDIEAICYWNSFEGGDNTILCRVNPAGVKIIIKFDLIQTTNTLFNFPNAKPFSKVMNSSSLSVTFGEVADHIRNFLRANLFPVATSDDGGVRNSLKSKLVPSDQDQIIEAIIKEINNGRLPSLDKNGWKNPEEPWITFKKEWMLSESQEEFINSLCPSIICAGIGTFLLDYMKDIVSSNFTKSYKFLLIPDNYSDFSFKSRNDIVWLAYILKYNTRSLNYLFKNPAFNSKFVILQQMYILEGAGIRVFEAIQHSDMYCKPRIVSSVDLTASSSVFLNSKPDAIINLDISLGSTLFTCSLLDEDGLTQQIFGHNYFIGDKHLPPLGHFYTFSNTTILNVKQQFIPFAERYLLGELSDLIADKRISIKQDILLEMKTILTKDLSDGEELVTTDKQEYIKAFILIYMIYIKEEILYKLPEQLISDQMEMKIGYAVSIEAMLLNNTVKSKDNLRDIIYASGLVLKDDNSKKLRITTQGEGILPAIQKSLKLELSLKSYFLLCQLYEDYVQLSLHQVVTTSSSEEKEQESIIVQDEIIPIHNVYDSLCLNVWYSLMHDSSLIELCEAHNTSDNNRILDLFSLKIKKEFFANLKLHISDNVLQNNSGSRSTNAVNFTSSCNCKVHLTISDIIDVSFTPVLQGITYILYASLSNKELFGNYININYLFSLLRFSNNPQLQYAFSKILEQEADNSNPELGIDKTCLVVPELFNQLLHPVIAQRPFCYKDFKIGALQQVCSENCVIAITQDQFYIACPVYKSKKSDTKTIECGPKIAFPFLNKGEIINNVRSNRRFYLRNKKNCDFHRFNMVVYRFKTMNYLENYETLSLDDNTYQSVSDVGIFFDELFELKDVDVPVMVSVKYVSYTSSLQFSVKIVGADTRYGPLKRVVEASELLTLTRF